MTPDKDTPYVTDAFVSIDIGDLVLDVRTMLDSVAPAYLVVTDRTAVDGVFVLDVDAVRTLFDDLVDVEADVVVRLTGADLVQQMQVSPSYVVNLVTGESMAETVSGVDLEQVLGRRLVVTVDDAVRAVVDTAAPADDAEPLPALEGLRVNAWRDRVAVSALTSDTEVTGLQVLVPGEVPYDAVVPLVVLLTRPGDDEPDIEFPAEIGERISVVVWPQEGVAVTGAATATLTVSEDGAGDTATIELKITSPTRASLIVEAFRDQTSLGSALVELRVVVGGGALPATQRAAVLPLERGQAPRSDLALHIVEARAPGGDGRGLRFVVIEPGQEPVAFPFQPISGDAHAYLTPLFESINAALAQTPAGAPVPTATAEDVVRGIGLTLATQLLPAQLREFIWANRERVRSIVVHSDEALIPWELCLLTHTGADGRTEELGFLCELFELTRWRPRLPAREKLTMRRIGVIAPGDSGLNSREDEVTMLQGLATADRSVETVQATTASVLQTLQDGTYDVLHFVGHGELPDPSRASSARLVLAGESYLSAEWIGGAAANFGLASPLVFLNACRLGSASAGLVGPSGFARVLLDAGSAAFVGAHWDVVDARAHEFATEFYRQLVGGEPVGRAALAARLAIRAPGDPTWLAYTVFASPTAALG